MQPQPFNADTDPAQLASEQALLAFKREQTRLKLAQSKLRKAKMTQNRAERELKRKLEEITTPHIDALDSALLRNDRSSVSVRIGEVLLDPKYDDMCYSFGPRGARCKRPGPYDTVDQISWNVETGLKKPIHFCSGCLDSIHEDERKEEVDKLLNNAVMMARRKAQESDSDADDEDVPILTKAVDTAASVVNDALQVVNTVAPLTSTIAPVAEAMSGIVPYASTVAAVSNGVNTIANVTRDMHLIDPDTYDADDLMDTDDTVDTSETPKPPTKRRRIAKKTDNPPKPVD